MTWKRFIQELKDRFDEEKSLDKKKSILKNKIDRIKRIDKSKKELEDLRKELDKLENPRPDSK